MDSRNATVGKKAKKKPPRHDMTIRLVEPAKNTRPIHHPKVTLVDASSGSSKALDQPKALPLPNITMDSMFDGIIEVELSIPPAKNDANSSGADFNSNSLESNDVGDDHFENHFDDGPISTALPEVSHRIPVRSLPWRLPCVSLKTEEVDVDIELLEATDSRHATPLSFSYLERILALEAPKDPNLACHFCTSAKPHLESKYRCADCIGGMIHCGVCLRERHRTLPFHRITKWTAGADSFFEPTTLKDEQFIFYLGHGGHRCPQTTLGVDVKMLTVMDRSGIHSLNVVFCACDDLLGQTTAHDLQLIDSELFPATKSRPRTAFTFRLLRFFQTFNLASKTSMWDFTQALIRLTKAHDFTSVSV